ncbi:LamG-like jellyroll fold domain-containing protein [Jonesiaceae bacterium BS-20]|uniref:LamG-like jellyroll fold domain-containing protein n=1 Tax=Jonesiaceae bacterium BS-20 TaxID=3120821 RepID=A0AAU7DSV6_9MICO
MAATIPLTLATALVAVPAAAAPESLPEPVLKYTFDDDSTDTIANTGTAGEALNGVIKNGLALERGVGATAATGTSGVFPGGPRSSSTVAPYVQIPAGLFEDADALTVSTWIKWDGQYGNDLPWAYIVGSDKLPSNNWGVYFQPSEDGQSKATSNSGSEVKIATTALEPDAWTHLTTVIDGSTMSHYVNGVHVGSVPASTDVSKLAVADSTFSGLIGSVQWTPDWAAPFPGEFDDFTVYHEALTGDQAAELFAQYTGEIVSVGQDTFSLSTPAGQQPKLPEMIEVTYADGSTISLPITWDSIPAQEYEQPGNEFNVLGFIPGWDGEIVATITVENRETDAIDIDFGQLTGEFRGGASGTLYGFGDEQSPTQALVNGAAMTNASQKPPFGTQHPGGDVFHIEETFFDKWGKDLYVYAQDYYPDWPYNRAIRPGDDLTFVRDDSGRLTGETLDKANGTWDYLEVLEIVTEAIATQAADPTKYVFIPFNEPDGIWYQGDGTKYRNYLINGGQPDSFTPNGVSDWEAAWDVIADVYDRHGLARPKIAGPGDMMFRWEANIKEFLTKAVQTNTVPEIYVWHELQGYPWLEDRMEVFRKAALAAGVSADNMPDVNITEWGASNDMSSPANLLHWFASFEAAKVDAQTAYWTASGTLSDNHAMVNSANGGWWLFKWYGDMHGSQTVKVTKGRDRAIGAIDQGNKRGQVLYGSIASGKDALINLSGLDKAGLGNKVDIEVREARVSGTDGQAATPRVVAAFDTVVVEDGKASVRVSATDNTSAYQLIITPATDRDVEADQASQATQYVVEAENTQLQAATSRTSPGGGYRASNGRDVWSFNAVDSQSNWTVTVAEDGLYELQVIGATPGVSVQHALFVDGEFSQKVQYGANATRPNQVRTVARGSAEVYVKLSAGTHELSIRTSKDGTTLMPNAGFEGGVTLDRYTLTKVGADTNASSENYPATTFRLADGATISWTGAQAGWAKVGEDQRADVYPAVRESGYYDLVVDWVGATGAELDVAANGRVATTFSASEGVNSSRVRLHLPQGISEIELFGADGVVVEGFTLTRATEGDASIVVVEAEDLNKVTLGGTAAVQNWGNTPTNGIATNGTGNGYVGGLGITDRDPENEGTMTIARGNGFSAAGEYNAIVHYSNDSIEGTHDYNPQVVDLGLQAKEAGSDDLVGRTTFRYTYLRTNFWEAVMPLSLSTSDGAIEFGNTRETLYIDEGKDNGSWDDVAVDGYAIAPNVDRISFAPFVLESDGTTTPGDGDGDGDGSTDGDGDGSTDGDGDGDGSTDGDGDGDGSTDGDGDGDGSTDGDGDGSADGDDTDKDGDQKPAKPGIEADDSLAKTGASFQLLAMLLSLTVVTGGGLLIHNRRKSAKQS